MTAIIAYGQKIDQSLRILVACNSNTLLSLCGDIPECCPSRLTADAVMDLGKLLRSLRPLKHCRFASRMSFTGSLTVDSAPV